MMRGRFVRIARLLGHQSDATLVVGLDRHGFAVHKARLFS